MKRGHWLLAGFMAFNIACVVENAFPGWSSIYASAQGAAEGGLDLVASVTDHWINRYGIYLPTYPNFDFFAWSELALYITLGLLVRLLIKSELALRSLRRERLEREKREKAAAERVSESVRPAANPPAKERSRKASASSAGRRVREQAPKIDEELDVSKQTVYSAGLNSTDYPFIFMLAIERGYWVVFDYEDSRLNATRRWVKPLRVLYGRSGVYLKGFCRLRGEERTFKISRMSNVWIVDRKEKSA